MSIKNWLPWLSDKEREIIKLLVDNVIKEHFRLKWHNYSIIDDFPGPWTIEADSIESILFITGMFRAQLKYFNTRLFFRGQKKDYPLIPTIFRNMNSKTERVEIYKRCNQAIFQAGKNFNPSNENNQIDIRIALAQHYGCKTWYLDIVDHPHSAVWFAHDTTGQCKEGYLYLFAAPIQNNISQKKSFPHVEDLRTVDAHWIRPHIQQALGICDLASDRIGETMDYLVVAKIIVKQSLLEKWSNTSVYSKDVMFPNKLIDSGFHNALETQKSLQEQGYEDIWPEVK